MILWLINLCWVIIWYQKLSANDCYRNESDQLRDVKGIINEGVDIEGKAEEDPCVADGGSNPEMGGMKSDDHDTDKEVVASSKWSEKKNVMEVAVEGEQMVQDNVEGGNDNLFVDSSSDSNESVVKSPVTKKGGTNTVSGKERIAESDDDNNEDGESKNMTTKSKIVGYVRLKFSCSVFIFL